MTHASVPPAMRQAMGLTDSLVRLSCGVEDIDDLLADLDQAFVTRPGRRVFCAPQRHSNTEITEHTVLHRATVARWLCG